MTKDKTMRVCVYPFKTGGGCRIACHDLGYHATYPSGLDFWDALKAYLKSAEAVAEAMYKQNVRFEWDVITYDVPLLPVDRVSVRLERVTGGKRIAHGSRSDIGKTEEDEMEAAAETLSWLKKRIPEREADDGPQGTESGEDEGPTWMHPDPYKRDPIPEDRGERT